MRNKIYQDVWIRGRVVRNGDRPCIQRNISIENFLTRYDSPITRFNVLDFGANMGFFSFNTAYNHPHSNVTMVDYEPLLPCLDTLNGLPNTTLIHKFMETKEIYELLEKKDFDVIYVMSVLHHFENYKELIDLFIEKSNNVIFEIGYPNEVPEVNRERVIPIYDYIQKKNPIQINNWYEHDRPIYYVNDEEKAFKGKVHVGAQLASTQTFPAIKYQLQHAFKKEFFPGTLNIKLREKIQLKNEFYIAEVYRVYPCFLNGFPVYCMLTQDKEGKVNEIELISQKQLRSAFNLNDGNEVIVSFDKKYLVEE